MKSGLVKGGRVLGGVKRTGVQAKAESQVVLDQFKTVMSEYEGVEGIAFAFPGPFDYEHGVCLVQGLEKYGELYRMNLTESLDLRLPVHYVNDAEAAIVGEARYGAGRGLDRVLGITLGTGLGSAFLIGGKRVVEGLGVPEDGWLYHQMFQGRIADDVFSIRGLLRRAEQAGLRASEPKEITDSELWLEFGRDLGRFLKPFVENFRADKVLVLGGLSGAFDSFQKSLNQQLQGLAGDGQLEGEAPLLGAAALFEDRFS